MFGYSPAVVIIGAAAVYIVLVILLIHANGISTADIVRNKQWFTVRCGHVYSIWLTFVHVAMAVTLCILLGHRHR